MKNAIFFACILTISLAIYFAIKKQEKTTFRIGIVLPMQHTALDDIIHGFESELTALLKEVPFEVEVQNAMGDIHLQRTAISAFLNQKVDLLVPVGKSVSQMAIQLADSKQPILFLAAHITPDSEEVNKKPDLMGIIDEIPLLLQIQFLKKALPDLKKITVILSSSEKVFDEVNELTTIAKKEGIVVQKIMVQALSELYTVGQHVDLDSQGIFVLKDHLVVSGINALKQQAAHLKIPVIASDEGSVQNGATFALGVVEADIGRQGARLAAKWIKKQDIVTESTIESLHTISAFINQKACAQNQIDPEHIASIAQSLDLSVNKR